MAAWQIALLSTIGGALALPESTPIPASPVQSVSIESVLAITTGPTPVDEFNAPAGLLVDREHGIYVVADRGKHRLVMLDLTGRCRGTVSFETGANVRSGEPKALATDAEGRLFVVDALDPRVRVLSPLGSELGHLPIPWPDEPRRIAAESVAIGASGRIYVVFAGEAGGLAVYDRKGRILGDLGIRPDSGTLQTPVSVAVDASESRLAITDPRGSRQVLICTPEGRVLTTFGEHGEGSGTFSMAAHVTWGPENTLWITDTLRHSITICDPRGAPIDRVGGFGPGPGQFTYPIACQPLEDERLLVLERGGARCQLLKLSMELLDHETLSKLEVGESQPPELGSS